MANTNREWRLQEREQLEKILRQGYSVTKAAEMLGISKYHIRKELEIALTEGQFQNRQWCMYRAKNAVDKLLASYKETLTRR